MANDLSTITLVGRFTRDPEVKNINTNSGDTALAKFSLANNQYVSGEDQVSYFDCEAWGHTATIIDKYCQKGKQVAINGSIRIDRWEDKEGNSRSKPVVRVFGLQLLGSEGSGGSKTKSKSSPAPVKVNESEIPF